MRTVPNPRNAWTPEEARQLFDEHQRVGRPLSEFARERGISPARLYWWKKRLAEEESSPTQLSLVP
jgi:transposase